MNFDIYDEKKLKKQLHIQQTKEWSFEEQIDWSLGVDISKPLLPINQSSNLFPTASDEQRLVISQLVGLIVASSISQLENIACRLKKPTWENFLRKYPVNPEFFELGEQFFKEEEKHAKAFTKYIDLFAKEVNIDPSDLKSFLPQTSNSIIGNIYKLNANSGGMAMWWLIAAVEEESILFYKYIDGVKSEVDPLYYNIHRCHFEEEIRHKNYSLMMLDAYHQFARSPQSMLFKKLDFILAEVLHISWTFNQLIKVKELNKYKNHHPFFETLSSTMELLEGTSFLEIVSELFSNTPYISDTLHLSEHQHINELLNRFKSFKIPLPKKSSVELSCTV